ncbi:MAG: LacI family DNA-binding transcriptional regulator [Syntrophothermus sp.]
MAVTIKDVAEKAKVSIATVSLVIHNHQRISPETRHRVNKAIQELNYHPSRNARGLATKQTGNIGFLLTEDHFLRSEPFYTRIFLGTEFGARDFGYYMLLTTIPSDFTIDKPLPRFVLERTVDGIIIAGKVPDDIITIFADNDLPMVFTDYYPASENYPVVLIDNFSGGIHATQHLINLGHRRIAFIGGDIQHPSIRDRFQGYKFALETAGISSAPEKYIIDESYPSRENGYNAIRRLWENNKDFTAVFACNDAMAIGVMQFLKEKGYRIPKDISLIGFDDVEAGLLLDPPLSTISVPKVEMGIEAVRLMNAYLQEKNKSPKKVLVPAELIKRSSTGPAGELM